MHGMLTDLSTHCNANTARSLARPIQGPSRRSPLVLNNSKLHLVGSSRNAQSGLELNASSELPKKLTEARKKRKQGLLASGAFLVSAAALTAAAGIELPLLPSWALWLLPAAFIIPAPALILGKAVLGERLQIEFHEGRIYLQWSPLLSAAAKLAEGAVLVQPSEGKGNGAFAAQFIPAGTFLGDYEGELLDEAAYWQRYPTGVADYCIGVDRQWTIDARDRAKDTAKFSTCHMNHSAKRHNVVRRCSRAERRVSFYTARDLQPGEEILIDYGRLYWTGRETEEVE